MPPLMSPPTLAVLCAISGLEAVQCSSHHTLQCYNAMHHYRDVVQLHNGRIRGPRLTRHGICCHTCDVTVAQWQEFRSAVAGD